MMERGVVLADDDEPIGVSDLFPGQDVPSASLPAECLALPSETQIESWLEQYTLEDVTRLMVEQAVERAEGNISRAARRLGISRRQLEYRLQKETS